MITLKRKENGGQGFCAPGSCWIEEFGKKWDRKRVPELTNRPKNSMDYTWLPYSQA